MGRLGTALRMKLQPGICPFPVLWFGHFDQKPDFSMPGITFSHPPVTITARTQLADYGALTRRPL